MSTELTIAEICTRLTKLLPPQASFTIHQEEITCKFSNMTVPKTFPRYIISVECGMRGKPSLRIKQASHTSLTDAYFQLTDAVHIWLNNPNDQLPAYLTNGELRVEISPYLNLPPKSSHIPETQLNKVRTSNSKLPF